MNPQTLQATFSCLLHDIGNLVSRAGEDNRNHSEAGYDFLAALLPGGAWRDVLGCVRWHHANGVRQVILEGKNLAYIVCAADSIATAADLREIVGEDSNASRSLPLYSIFTHLNGEHPDMAVEPAIQNGRFRMPGRQPPVQPARYQELLRTLRQGVGRLELSPAWMDSLLCVLESCTSTVPAGACGSEKPDISLFDHLKVTATLGACISEYLLNQGITDYRTYLFEHEEAFRADEVFLLYTADLSGIQKFIYTVATDGAQRSLRSRSFFLELLMEHFIDELLYACGLSRANLIYSGGGHCYLLLPNTKAVHEEVGRVNRKFNDWLLNQFGTRLFLAHGWAPCSADDLTNTPAAEAPYKAIFSRASTAIGRHKLKRYTADQMRRLNAPRQGLEGRECIVCGSADVQQDNRCRWCARFEALSTQIQSPERIAYYVTANASGAWDLQLPGLHGEAYLSLVDEETARSRAKNDAAMLRVYTKNKAFMGLANSVQLHVCDYFASNQNEELAQAAAGIRRLAICRMDVDNLGQAFVAGFEREQAASSSERFRFVTLSRSATLSRQLSLFFKRYMNEILRQRSADEQPLQVSVVYSGGDDVFFIGAWDHVVRAARRIQRQFVLFSGGALTLSCGIGLYDAKYPIRLAAEETAELEQRAKTKPGKNAIALFDPLEDHTYAWPTFGEQVIGQKYQLLEIFFVKQAERGIAFLYRMMALLRQANRDRLNLARYAYLLARLQPSPGSKDYSLYSTFSKQMYAWACSEEDRKQLITAIYLYVYINRKVE